MINSGQLIKELSDQQSELGKLAKMESTNPKIKVHDYNESLTAEFMGKAESQPWWKETDNQEEPASSETPNHVVDYNEPINHDNADKIESSNRHINQEYNNNNCDGLSQTDTSKEPNISDIIPSGHDGINKENRTLSEIAEKPITDECAENVHKELSGIDPATREKMLEDFGQSVNVPKKHVDKHVDLKPAKLGDVEIELPDAKDYPDLLGKEASEITDDDIRKYNYDKFHEALADKYGITKTEASLFIGKIDSVIHEDENGTAYLVPNNMHKYTELYAHNGYVSKILNELKD